MNTTANSRLQALLCALLLLLCALVIHPVAEIGMNDDWAYIKSAQVLAQTGHVAYNGWAAAMLGWQLLLGAAFAKLFGTSFTAIRASTLLVALATAYLTQRTFVKAGLTSRNALIGTLALVLSPLFLPLAVGFMSDIYGFFCIVMCLYACMRALEAQTTRATLLWIAFAGFSNAIGGTARQIAWLGVLVMVPCTVWLLRRRPYVIPTGLMIYLLSSGIIFASIRWFQHQPYSVPESIIPGVLDRHSILQMIKQCARAFLSCVLYLSPILLAFLPSFSRQPRRLAILLGADGLLGIAVAIFFHHRHKPVGSLVPFSVNTLTAYGFLDGTPIKGVRPILFAPWVQLLLAALTGLAFLAFLSFLSSRPFRSTSSSQSNSAVSWRELLTLLLPFTIAYCILLLPRAAFQAIFDRYLVPLLFIGILLLLRLYQEIKGQMPKSESHTPAKLPTATLVLLAIFAVFTVVGVHDAFSMYRGRLAAVNELLAAGVPDTAIDGGFEFNGMTQIQHIGYINDPRIRVPRAIPPPPPSPLPEDCQPQMASLTPAVMPAYSISYDPAMCGGPSHFNPVTYQEWLGPRTVTLYIINTVRLAPPSP